MRRFWGGLLGAVGVPVVIIVATIIAYGDPGTENWDFGTPILTLGFAAFGVFIGGVGGYLIAAALEAGDRKLVKIFAGAVALYVAFLPVALVALRIWARHDYARQDRLWRSDSAQASRRRDEWLSAMRAMPVDDMDHQGRRVAGWVSNGLERGEGALAEVRWRLSTEVAGDKGARGGAYRLGYDDGWRWDYVPGDSGRAIVYIDPAIHRAMPVYVAYRYMVLRKANRAAPAFSTDTALADLLKIPDCLARFAQAAHESGKWNGAPDSLPVVMATRWQRTPEGCHTVFVADPPRLPGGWWRFYAQTDLFKTADFTVAPADSGDPPLSVRVSSTLSFLREPNGKWHVRPGGSFAEVTDPAPPRCLFDLSIPCDR